MVFNYPNVDALAKYLYVDVLKNKINSDENHNTSDSLSNNGVDNIISNVEQLSDEEAEAELLRKLNSDDFEI
jgi:hypothetical protein